VLNELANDLNLLEVDTEYNDKLLEKVILFPLSSDKLIQSLKMIKTREITVH
jgi:hypothetical protein